MLRIYVKDDADATNVSYRVDVDSAGKHHIDVHEHILFAEIPEEIPDEKILGLSYMDNFQTPPKRTRGVYRHQSAWAIVKDLSPKTQAQPGMLGLIITATIDNPNLVCPALLDMRELYKTIMDGTAAAKGYLAQSWGGEEEAKQQEKFPRPTEIETKTNRE